MTAMSLKKAARIALGLLATFTVSTSAHALMFEFTFDPSLVTAFGSANEAALESDIISVGNTYSSLYNNNVTLNFNITTTDSGLAASLASYDQSKIYSYADIRAALVNGASTPASAAAVNSLPGTDPSNLKGGYILNTAESKALGLIAGNGTALDGTMYVSTNIAPGYSWNFAGNSQPSSSQYSFVDGAEHEISELMGRTTQLGNSGWPWNSPIDLFRYTAPHVINTDPNATGVYFSVDGGVTRAKDYNAPNNDGADIQDWAGDQVGDPYDAYSSNGFYTSLSIVDHEMMNTLGWRSDTAVPEPSSWVLLLTGFGAIGIAIRSRRDRAAVVA